MLATVHAVFFAAASTTTHLAPVDVGVFAVAAATVLAGAIGVVVSRNPVHAALMLVMTLFGIAILFLLQGADFLAVVQIIVYAGAIVVLFLFVIMFLGVDREENIRVDPLRGQRPLAIGLGVLGVTGLMLLGWVSHWTSGAPAVAGSTTGSTSNVAQLGQSVYTTYLFPFEVTSALLVIAVIGAVVLARRPPVPVNPEDPPTGDGDGMGSEPDGAGAAQAGAEEPITPTTTETHEEVAP